jgi:hypothetical protein
MKAFPAWAAVALVLAGCVHAPPVPKEAQEASSQPAEPAKELTALSHLNGTVALRMAFTLPHAATCSTLYADNVLINGTGTPRSRYDGAMWADGGAGVGGSTGLAHAQSGGIDSTALADAASAPVNAVYRQAVLPGRTTSAEGIQYGGEKFPAGRNAIFAVAAPLRDGSTDPLLGGASLRVSIRCDQPLTPAGTWQSGNVTASAFSDWQGGTNVDTIPGATHDGQRAMRLSGQWAELVAFQGDCMGDLSWAGPTPGHLAGASGWMGRNWTLAPGDYTVTAKATCASTHPGMVADMGYVGMGWDACACQGPDLKWFG